MKWGILATGTIAKKFASTVEQMGAEGERLVAVGSRHLESAQAFAQQYGIPRCYDSYEALAADPEVEAIYIATPNTLHYENCRLCLEQGKHVLCEKPFTINPEQAQELYRLCLLYTSVGNFGGAWQDQQKEFDHLPGAILMTTNCLMPVSYTHLGL